MEWNWEKIWPAIVSGTLISAVAAFVGKQMDWIRFGSRDKAKIKKIESETGIDLAEINAKKIDDEIKISKAALEWTVQLSEQLERAHLLNEKRQRENDALHEMINKMRTDFDARIQELETALDKSQQQLAKERREIEKLRQQLNDRR